MHNASVAMYDHCNNGFTKTELLALLRTAGLEVDANAVATIEESRPPFHRVHVLLATRP